MPPEEAPRAVRAWPRPTASGVAVLALALALALLRPPGPLGDALLLGLVGLLGVAAAQAWRLDLRRVELRRRLPPVATQGELLPVVHEVRLARGGALLDLEVRELDVPGAWSLFPALWPGARAEARAGLVAGRRGLLQLQRVALRAGDPFGLFQVEAVRALPAQLLVRPRPRRREAWRLLARARLDARPGPRAADPWEAVREWRPGDPLRLVHWRLSARRGFPVVRLGRVEAPRAALLVLDRRPAPLAATVRFERAVSLAAGVGLTLLERGQTLTFLAPGARDPLTLEALRGREGQDRLLEALARVQLDPRGLAALAQPLPPQALVIGIGEASAPGSTRGARTPAGEEVA